MHAHFFFFLAAAFFGGVLLAFAGAFLGGVLAGAFFFLLAPGFLATLLVVRFVGAIVDRVLLLCSLWAIRLCLSARLAVSCACGLVWHCCDNAAASSVYNYDCGLVAMQQLRAAFIARGRAATGVVPTQSSRLHTRLL